MSRIKFAEPIDNASGKVFGKSNISHRTLYGTKHTYTWDPETKVIKTPGRLIHQEALGEANHYAMMEMQDEQKTKDWIEKRRKANDPIPLNAFIIKHVLPEIKERLQEEWKDKSIDEMEALAAERKSARAKARRANR